MEVKWNRKAKSRAKQHDATGPDRRKENGNDEQLYLLTVLFCLFVVVAAVALS